MKTIRLIHGFLYNVGAFAGNLEEGEKLGISVNYRMTALLRSCAQGKKDVILQCSKVLPAKRRKY